MKLSTIFLACSVSVAETDDSPIAKLNHLENIATEIFFTESFRSAGSGRVGKRWAYRWTARITRNGSRMRESFAKCGTTPLDSDNDIDEEYDIDNACGAIKQLTTGFSNWVNRHMSLCRGQRKSHHEKRITRWQNLLHKGNGFDLYFLE